MNLNFTQFIEQVVNMTIRNRSCIKGHSKMGNFMKKVKFNKIIENDLVYV